MSQTETAVLKVRIYSYSVKSGISRNIIQVRMILLKEVNDILDFREIVFDRIKLCIRRPSIDSNKTIKVVGEYEVEIVNEDCLKLTKI